MCKNHVLDHNGVPNDIHEPNDNEVDTGEGEGSAVHDTGLVDTLVVHHYCYTAMESLLFLNE